MKTIWLAEPKKHDYPAAQDYLELILSPILAKGKVTELIGAKTIKKKAKDIFRASGLSLLPKDNKHVAINLKKFKTGNKLSPLLLVRGNHNLIIADGYHRLCASYYLSEDLEVPCKLV